MKIAIACDHGGLNLKKALIEYLVKNGYEYVDFGTTVRSPAIIPIMLCLPRKASPAGNATEVSSFVPRE